MDDLERRLEEAADARLRMIVTDGVFSMDGDFARLPEICDLAEKHDALVLVDESHATGFIGPTGRGTHEKLGVMGRVDMITTTLGKALGGGLGGCTAGPAEIVAWLRQKSRPYLFSNSLPPVVCGATLEVLRILREDPAPLRDPGRNQNRLRAGPARAGLRRRSRRAPHRPGALPPPRERRPDGPGRRPRPARRGHLLHRLQLSRWCRRGRRASACRPRPPTPPDHVERCLEAFAQGRPAARRDLSEARRGSVKIANPLAKSGFRLYSARRRPPRPGRASSLRAGRPPAAPRAGAPLHSNETVPGAGARRSS